MDISTIILIVAWGLFLAFRLIGSFIYRDEAHDPNDTGMWVWWLFFIACGALWGVWQVICWVFNLMFGGA